MHGVRISYTAYPLLLLAIGHLPQISFGQNNSPMFYEIIREDSALLFFTERNMFAEKKCADFVRYTRLDNTGAFDGYFEDRSNENMLIGKGNYVHGKKEGHFELYHPTGTIKSRGTYRNNIPLGQWEFFYESGSPERILRITETDTLLVRFFDKKGNLKVENGFGEFNGFVAGNSVVSDLITAKGSIEDGKPHGKWLSTINDNIVYCKEVFERGRLVQGVFPNAQLGGVREYHDQSFLNTFFLPGYFNSLEEFKLESCADVARYPPKNYAFNLANFNSDLREKIDRVIENDIRTERTEDYSIGDHDLTIQFTVNAQGKTEDFRLLSPWGQQFFRTISDSIKSQTTFPSGSKTMFFHLKLTIPGGLTYLYNFQFSKDRVSN